MEPLDRTRLRDTCVIALNQSMTPSVRAVEAESWGYEFYPVILVTANSVSQLEVVSAYISPSMATCRHYNSNGSSCIASNIKC
jgi:hypothetical protein